jgi:photosystem II stability/assembly factor-like uncharacterized protein
MRPVGWILAALVYCAQGQPSQQPFTATWLEGRCIHCKVAKYLHEVFWLSRSEAWGIGLSFDRGAPGDYVLVHSIDAGRTWREMPDTYQYAVPPTFTFLDAAHGWLSCVLCPKDTVAWEVRRTSDGGKHWQVMTHQTATERMVFADEQHGIAKEFRVGGAGGMIQTADGGRSWSEIEIPHLKKIRHMFNLGSRALWVTDYQGSDLLIFRTTDGGQNWDESRITLPPDWPQVGEISFTDLDHGWMILQHKQDLMVRLLGTTDGGRHWKTLAIPPAERTDFVPRSDMLGFLSAKMGFLFSTGGDSRAAWDPNYRKALVTTDGGERWQEYPLPYDISSCQMLNGELLCSADKKGTHFGILVLRPR